MNQLIAEITTSRIYSLEGHDHLNQALDIQREEEKIMGVTIMRGIAEFSENRETHTSSLLKLSLEWPLKIQSYDKPDKVEKAIQLLKSRLDFKHIITWSSTAHIYSTS
jgi:PII-like signaling protein